MKQPDDSWFRALADAAADGVLVIDERSAIVYANAAGERLFGYGSGELAGRQLTELMPEALRARHVAGLERYLATGERRIAWEGTTFQGLGRDGEELQVEVAFAEIAGGGSRLFAGFVRDVRNRRAERERLERHYQEAARRARMLETVGDLARVANEASDLGIALARVVDAIHERLAMPLAQVFLARDDGGELTLRAQATTEPSPSAIGSPWSPEAGVVGRAFRTGRTQLVLDVASDPDYVPVHPQVRSEMAVPIHLEGRCLGVLNLESSDPRDFSEENVRILGLLAQQVAGALSLAMANDRLSAAVSHLSRVNRELHAATDSLLRVSRTDGLTGLANRRGFDEALDREWRRARREAQPLSLLIADIDHFKDFNDRCGHPTGDRCLQQVARCLAAQARRAGDLVARFGGDEFAVLLSSQAADPARWVAERLRAEVEALAIPHPGLPDSPTVLTVSVGVATGVPVGGASQDALVTAADRSLYAAKQGGRNRVRATLLEAPARHGRRAGT
jgi:diguanylate cyclase (GGDEF)-like protein/PAS domain S-box-containing protein